MMTPASYWRSNKLWKEWLGKKGSVIAATVIHVAPPSFEHSVPYAYVLVDFGKAGKHEFLGEGNQTFAPGDLVRCVLKKLGKNAKKDIIEYGIKVEKIEKQSS